MLAGGQIMAILWYKAAQADNKNHHYPGSIAMKNNKHTTSYEIKHNDLIVAVDIGKKKNHGYFCTLMGKEKSSIVFWNTGQGFKLFYKELRRFMMENKLARAIAGFESTGVYGLPLAHFLRSRKVVVVQVNPFHTKQLKELSDNSPNKTDKKDPRVIADIMKLGHALRVVVPEGPAAELRHLSHARERLLAHKRTCCNQLHDVAFRIFPELVICMHGVNSKSMRYLLRYYPTPAAVRSCGVSTLAKIFKKVSRGKLGEEQAREVYAAGMTSAGIVEGREAMLIEIGWLLDHIEHTEAHIAECERHMEEQLALAPESACMMSMKGISTVTASGLIGELGGFGEYRNAAAVLKMAGLNLYEISSGAHEGERRITKRGRALLRKLVYLAVLNMVRSGGVYHERYHAMIARGMPKMKAIVAISRKLLTVQFALVRDRSIYGAPAVKQAA